MASGNELGDFLRSRRAQVRPEDVGLPGGGHRKVAGLRREELASIAGVSVDYYTRLEQGRERHPSDQVIDALARALGLGTDAVRYLQAVASPRPASYRTATNGRPSLSSELTAMVEDWTMNPAVIVDRTQSVLGGNQLGMALFAGGVHSDNIIKLVFLDPFGRTLFRDWDVVAAGAAAALRAAASYDPDDPVLKQLVGELSIRSAEFATLWSKAEVQEKTSGVIRLHRSDVGDLDLGYTTLRPTEAPGLLIKTYRAAPKTDTYDRLAMLGSLTTRAPADRDRFHLPSSSTVTP